MIHDYVPFYFGVHSPMLLRLKTGWVDGYEEGQEPLVYLRTTAQAVRDANCRFVFSDGHGLAKVTQWFDDLADLTRLDWPMIRERYWRDTVADPDRQRRKQAEFLVRGSCAWDLIEEIGVINASMQERVETLLAAVPANLYKPVNIRSAWYY